MCFSMAMSAAFAAIGLYILMDLVKNLQHSISKWCLLLFTMELLQAIQYFFIASSIDSPICDTIMNQVLTIAGFLHICLQPYFCHVINASLTKNTKYIARYLVIKRDCMLFGRFLYAYQWPQTLNGPSTEWLRGQKLCTYRGKYYLAWLIPVADPTYVIPGAVIHSFLMFAPFFALYEKKGRVIQGIFLFVFGPYLTGLITPNLMEQASIWCFFSIAQISIMLFCIRESLIIN